jgi:hypothetical protein
MTISHRHIIGGVTFSITLGKKNKFSNAYTLQHLMNTLVLFYHFPPTQYHLNIR